MRDCYALVPGFWRDAAAQPPDGRGHRARPRLGGLVPGYQPSSCESESERHTLSLSKTRTLSNALSHSPIFSLSDSLTLSLAHYFTIALSRSPSLTLSLPLSLSKPPDGRGHRAGPRLGGLVSGYNIYIYTYIYIDFYVYTYIYIHMYI